MSKLQEWISPDSDVLESEETKVRPPAFYKVVLNNDDYTPMEFVIEVLQRFFALDLERAKNLMLAVHYEGKAICGIFSAEIAEMKVSQVMNHAKEHQHPLLCTMEKA
jgi:ATP-dependent Clp protease adaptor protein ClpS